MQPKVSIVIPVYNTQDYLHESLDSLLNQTLHEIEVLCVDDCSTDTSPEILREYAAKDSRLKAFFFDRQHSALGARAKGVQEATGRYILFMDSDDYLSPDACEKLVAKIEAENVDILHFCSRVENCANLPQPRIDMNQRLLAPFAGKLTGSEVFDGCFVDKKYGFTLWNKLFRASLCKEAFAHMEDSYLPKAQDLYSYYIIAHYAQSYLGWNTAEPFHHYCFGRGVTGSSDLDEGKLERYCRQADVEKALRKFSAEAGMDAQKYEPLLDAYRLQWTGECARMWYDLADPENPACSFEMLAKWWKPAELVDALAQKYWFQRGKLARKVGRLPEGNADKKPLKTVAVYYYHYTIGGVQRVVAALIATLQSLGYRVVLVTDKQPDENDLPLCVGVDRVFVQDYQETDKTNYLGRARSWQAILDNYQVDAVVCHAWTSPMLLWDILFLKLQGISVTVQTHSVFSYALTTIGNAFYELPPIIGLADRVVVLSETDKAFWDIFSGNVTRIPNPVGEDFSTEVLSDGSEPNLVWIGRFSNEKQPWSALNIMQRVVEQVPEAKLYMVGDSAGRSLIEKFRSQAREKGIENNVIFTGYQQDVAPYLEKAAVNLVTSTYEGFSLVLIEAQAHGVPSVCYSMPYLDFGTPERGVVNVEHGNETAAAEAIVRLLRDKALWQQNSLKARESFRDIQAFDYAAAWQKVLTVGEPAAQVAPATRIMVNTILDHYAIGWAANNRQLQQIKKQAPMPYMLRRGIQCYRDNGLLYTLRNIRDKIVALFKH